MSTAMANIFHTPETAARMNAQQRTGSWESVIAWTGGDPTPINWTPDPNPINWTQPNYPWQQTYPSGPWTQPNYPWQWQQTYPSRPSIKTYVNCPHCGRNVEQQSSWTCSNCHQSLFTIPVDRSNLQITWRPWPIPVVPMEEQPRENLPLPKAPKEAHAGDGSRWDDI